MIGRWLSLRTTGIAEIERVARRRFERPDAALARITSVLPPLSMLGREQPLFDRRRDAALQQPGLRRVELAQQREFCMLRAPTWKMSIAVDQLDLALRSITSVTSFMFSASPRRAAAGASPRRGPGSWASSAANAPPRKIFAPALRTAAALARTCASFSAEQGPAMTITSSPPIRTSPSVMTVPSGLNVRLASACAPRCAARGRRPSAR